MRTIIIAIFAWMGCVWVSHAQSTNDNAAVVYQRAIDQLSQFRESSPDAYRLLMEFDPDVPASAQLRAALAQVQPMLQIAREAAAMPSCEFPLDRTAGINMMMPHLGQMRQIARMMNADALVRYQDGDSRGAASAASDIYRISNHFTTDGTIISSLVGNAIFALGDNTTQYGIDRGMLGEEESRSLQEGLQGLNATDPFHFAGAVAGERDMFGGWLEKRAAEEEEPGRFLAEIISGVADPGIDDDVPPWMVMTKERFQHEVELYNEVMGRMVDIFNMPDRDAAKIAMAEMEDEIEAMKISANHGGDGLLVGVLMPALGKCIEMRNRGEKMLSDRRAMLGALATGKASPRDFANAAIWYLRAIKLLEQTDTAMQAQIRSLGDDATLPISPDLQTALTGPALQETMGLFRDGSLNRRCDFSVARTRSLVELLPKYIAGMHDGVRLLHADTIRLVRAGQSEQALDNLITSLRMAAHLGGDPLILSSLTAHSDFNKTVGLLKSAVSGDDAAAHAPALADALELIEMTDPFGYVKSAIAARTQLQKRFLFLSPGLETPEDTELRQRDVADALRGLNADQLLRLTIVFDTMERNQVHQYEREYERDRGSPSPTAADYDPQARRALLQRIDDVLSLTDFETVQSDVGRLAPLLLGGEVELFDNAPRPPVASSKWAKSLADHIRRASSDVRSARTLVRSISE